MSELKEVEGGGLRRRPPGRTEILVRARVEVQFVIRRVVKREGGGGEEAVAWERDGEALSVRLGESAPVVPPVSADAVGALKDAAFALILANNPAEDADELADRLRLAAEETLLSAVAARDL
jgi:hypothetical protein